MEYEESPERYPPVIRAPPMINAANPARPGSAQASRINSSSRQEQQQRRFSPGPSYESTRAPRSPPPPYLDESPRRFAADSPPYFPARPPPPPPPGFLDESPRRFAGSSSPYRYSEGLPLPPPYQDESPYRYHSEPPSPPPSYLDDAPRRFAGGSPGLGGAAGLGRYETESPPHRYVDESPRRFSGLSPHRYLDEGPSRYERESPQRYLEDVPRRRYEVSPQRYLEAPPPGYGRGDQYDDSPPGAYAEDGLRRFQGGSTPPSRYADTAARFEGEGTPPRYTPDGSPPSEFQQRFLVGSESPRFPSNRPSPTRPSYVAAAGGATPPRYESRALPPAYGSPYRLEGTLSAAPAYMSPTRHDGSPPGPGYRGKGGYESSTLPSAYDVAPTTVYPPRQSPPSAYESEAGASGSGRGSSPFLTSDSADSTPRHRDSSSSPLSDHFPLRVPPGMKPVYGGEDLPGRHPDGTPPDVVMGGRPMDSTSQGPLPGFATAPRGYDTGAPGGFAAVPPQGIPGGYGIPDRSYQNVAHPYFRDNPTPFVPVALPRRRADGYTIRTPPRDDTRRAPRDEIYTANVPPISIDEKLKNVGPLPGNPGNTTGGAWKDMWFALVFILHIGGIAALSVIFGLHAIKKTINTFDTSGAYRITNWFPQLGAAAIVGTIFACVWQIAIRIAPVFMILFTIWSGAAIMTLLGIVLIATGKTTGLIGLLFFFAGLSQALYAFVVRARIPFAGDMLRKVITVLNKYPSTYIVSYLIVFVSLGWTSLWIFGVSGAALQPYYAFIIVGFVASLVWTLQVLRNIVRMAVVGTVAAFYNHGPSNMPRMPTYIALIRACTSCLGSVCFGSLVVPVIEIPCHVLRRINAQGGTNEFLFSCIVCFLGCFDTMIRYANKLAYIQIAVYGKPFVTASKDTWDLLKGQKVDCLVHDDLVCSILFIACGVGGSVSALVGGIWTFIAHKGLTISIAVICFIIGFSISYITLAVYESGVMTYYVCFAEDPGLLQRHDGPLFEKMWVRQMELQQNPLSETMA